jgi:hypothetical protein
MKDGFVINGIVTLALNLLLLVWCAWLVLVSESKELAQNPTKAA